MNEQPKPNPDLKHLDRLIGTWKQSGELDGEIRYEWGEGGFFLIQHVDFIHDGNPIKGMELISFLDGMTLDYVYEMEGDTLTIWGGEKGSPANYKGTFSKDGNTLSGAWVYPGGGYESVSTRIK